LAAWEMGPPGGRSGAGRPITRASYRAHTRDGPPTLEIPSAQGTGPPPTHRHSLFAAHLDPRGAWALGAGSPTSRTIRQWVPFPAPAPPWGTPGPTIGAPLGRHRNGPFSCHGPVDSCGGPGTLEARPAHSRDLGRAQPLGCRSRAFSGPKPAPGPRRGRGRSGRGAERFFRAPGCRSLGTPRPLATGVVTSGS